MAKNEDLPGIEDLDSLGQHTYSKTSRENLAEKPEAQFVDTAKFQAQEKNTLQETSKNSSILQPVNDLYTGEDSSMMPRKKHDPLVGQNYDPFEKVVLVKGIDNQILTSFRTLKRENNTISDTFKVVHQKFKPQVTKNNFLHKMGRQIAEKMSLYPHTDTEDVVEQQQAELLAASFLQQAQHQQNQQQQQHYQ